MDFNGDGKTDLCLLGGGRVALLQNGGESLNEVSLPVAGGARAAVWADYNGDGLPDLFLATPAGPKLFTNLGGSFRDDSQLLPREPGYNLTAATSLSTRPAKLRNRNGSPWVMPHQALGSLALP